MKKLILILILFLMFPVGASAQSIVDDAKAKVRGDDRRALVEYAASLIKKRERLERSIARIVALLREIDVGDFKAHEIPNSCSNCLTISTN